MSDKELTSVSRIRSIYLTLVRNQLESVGLDDITEADRRFGEMLRRVRADVWAEAVDWTLVKEGNDDPAYVRHFLDCNPYRDE